MIGWAVMGVVIGGWHANALWRRVASQPRPFGVLLRLSVVGVILFASAKLGHPLAALVGWALGFVAIVGLRTRTAR